MMSACWAIAWALSTASAPREVIIWVPLIRARPCKGKTEAEMGVFFRLKKAVGECNAVCYILCCVIVNANTILVPLNPVPEKPQPVFPVNPGSLVQVNQIWDSMVGFKHYLFGLQWYWPQSMGLQDLARDERRKKTCQSQGVTKQTCCPVEPCNLSTTFLTSKMHISCRLLSNHGKVIMRVLSRRSYIFGVCPSALWRPHFTLSHQPKGQVREGCQVSTSTHCSLLWDKGEAGSCRGIVTVSFLNIDPLSKLKLMSHFS